MLVLTREIGESIMMGKDLQDKSGIVIEIIRLKGKQISIGITAPNEIKIFRTELLTSNSEIINKKLNNKIIEHKLPEEKKIPVYKMKSGILKTKNYVNKGVPGFVNGNK